MMFDRAALDQRPLMVAFFRRDRQGLVDYGLIATFANFDGTRWLSETHYTVNSIMPLPSDIRTVNWLERFMNALTAAGYIKHDYFLVNGGVLVRPDQLWSAESLTAPYCTLSNRSPHYWKDT